MLPNQPALLDETDRKLYTLLALRELGGCTHTQLLYFMFENDIMSYFDLALALHELVDEGQLVRTNHPLDYLYAPTSAGLETLSFFINRLPHSKVVLICGPAEHRPARARARHGRAHGPPLARMRRQGISAIVESAL